MDLLDGAEWRRCVISLTHVVYGGGKMNIFFVVVGTVRINERWSVVVGILVKSRYSCISPCHVRLFAEMGSN